MNARRNHYLQPQTPVPFVLPEVRQRAQLLSHATGATVGGSAWVASLSSGAGAITGCQGGGGFVDCQARSTTVRRDRGPTAPKAGRENALRERFQVDFAFRLLFQRSLTRSASLAAHPPPPQPATFEDARPPSKRSYLHEIQTPTMSSSSPSLPRDAHTNNYLPLFYFNVFFACVSFSIIMPSLSPYLERCGAGDPTYLAWVVCIYSIGEVSRKGERRRGGWFFG